LSVQDIFKPDDVNALFDRHATEHDTFVLPKRLSTIPNHFVHDLAAAPDVSLKIRSSLSLDEASKCVRARATLPLLLHQGEPSHLHLAFTMVAAGRLLAYALTEGMCPGVRLPVALVSELLGRQPAWSAYIHDASMLKSLRHLEHDAQSFLQAQRATAAAAAADPLLDHDLRFSVFEKSPTGQVVEYALVEGGANIPVTSENFDVYVHLLARRHLLQGREAAIAWMKTGFQDLLSPNACQFLSAEETQELLWGSHDIDVQKWKHSVQYMGRYNSSTPVIQYFWDMVENHMSQQDRERLMLFWSGTSTAIFTETGSEKEWHIEPADFKPRVANAVRCPEAGTCDRMLFIPAYGSAEELRRAFSVALSLGAVGFDHT
jgi:hypothetical protein